MARPVTFDSLNRKIDEVKRDQYQNVGDVAANVEKLGQVEGETLIMVDQGHHFKKTAVKVKRTERCKQMKMYLIVGAVLLIILIILGVVLGLKFGGGNGKSGNP